MDEELGKQLDPPPNFPAPLTQPRERSSYKAVLITLFSSVLLGLGSCFGFMTTSNSRFGIVFAVLFLLCVIGCIGAIIWAIVSWLLDRQRGI
jgi:hypothetical protein